MLHSGQRENREAQDLLGLKAALVEQVQLDLKGVQAGQAGLAALAALVELAGLAAQEQEGLQIGLLILVVVLLMAPTAVHL